MAQYEDIVQKINQGLTDRQIAKSIGKRRSTISEIRKGLYKFSDSQKLPDWMSAVNWDDVLKDIALKHPLSLIWEESVQQLTSYSNFTRYLYKKFPQLKIADYTHRHTGKSWIKNKEPDLYSLNSEELKKCPQSEVKKRDFIRIYDKILEIIETTLPHSDKRKILIEKYKDYIKPETRIFRIEIQEMDRGLTKHLGSLLDSDKATFVKLADERLKTFAKRNPFKMWEDLLSGGTKHPAKK